MEGVRVAIKIELQNPNEPIPENVIIEAAKVIDRHTRVSELWEALERVGMKANEGAMLNDPKAKLLMFKLIGTIVRAALEDK